ncbi:MAG: hypothetical protein IPO63_16310 [Bacteroidetes bacterium]|nr:hypothetical protein [Bacteroidota bacterium]
MYKIKRTLLISLFLTTIISCSNNKDNQSTLFYLSFDDLSGYIDNSTIKINDLSFSGRNCVQLNKEYVYGPTFSKKMKDISPRIINKLSLSGWVKSDSKNGSILLVCSIDSADKTIFWNCADSKTLSGSNTEWTNLSVTFDLSKLNNGENKLNIYPMHSGEGNSYLDDLEFSFE